MLLIVWFAGAWLPRAGRHRDARRELLRRAVSPAASALSCAEGIANRMHAPAPWLATGAFVAATLHTLATDIDQLRLSDLPLVKAFDPANDADRYARRGASAQWVCEGEGCGLWAVDAIDEDGDGVQPLELERLRRLERSLPRGSQGEHSISGLEALSSKRRQACGASNAKAGVWCIQCLMT